MVTGNPQQRPTDTPTAAEFGRPSSAATEDEAVGIAFPKTDLRALALLGKGRDEGSDPHYLVLSAYPFAARGVRHRLTIETISPWQAGLEAGWDEGPSVTFFDARYYANSKRHEIGETYEFVLAGLAYLVKVTRPAPIFITDPERIRAMRTFSGEHHGNDAAVDTSPIEVRLAGTAILLPCQDLSPDDYHFQPPVKEIESFDMDGRPVTRLRCTVPRLESYVDIDLYATAAGMREGAHRRRRPRHVVAARIPGRIKADEVGRTLHNQLRRLGAITRRRE